MGSRRSQSGVRRLANPCGSRAGPGFGVPVRRGRHCIRVWHGNLWSLGAQREAENLAPADKLDDLQPVAVIIGIAAANAALAGFFIAGSGFEAACPFPSRQV